MAKQDVKMSLEIDPKTYKFFEQTAPERLQEARKNAVEAAGMVWADTAKEITRIEDHIDTGLYVNSIGYSTGTPSQPLNELEEQRSQTILRTGANVEYAEPLEKKFAIMARGIDEGKDRMQRVAETQIKNSLGL